MMVDRKYKALQTVLTWGYYLLRNFTYYSKIDIIFNLINKIDFFSIDLTCTFVFLIVFNDLSSVANDSFTKKIIKIAQDSTESVSLDLSPIPSH